jgi:hypothetical protein
MAKTPAVTTGEDKGFGFKADGTPRLRAATTRTVQAKVLNLLLVTDDDGKAIVALGSYNAQDTLTMFVKLTAEGKSPNLVTWVPPAKS